MTQRTLSACVAAGIPVYKFGSPELGRLHAEYLNPPMPVATRGDGWYFYDNSWHPKRTYVVHLQTYAPHAEGVQYVVDHDGFFTLNTLHSDQVCPASEDIAAH